MTRFSQVRESPLHEIPGIEFISKFDEGREYFMVEDIEGGRDELVSDGSRAESRVRPITAVLFTTSPFPLLGHLRLLNL